MVLNVILLIIGLALVVFGADWLVDGASGIARRLGVSEFVIGLTIVGFGTSCPELVVSLTGAFSGISDVAIGNVIGSNIFNVLLILGFTAFLMPIGITPANRRRDIPITAGVTVLLILAGMSKTILGLGSDSLGLVWGIVFLLLFAAYIFMCFKFDDKSADVEEPGKTYKLSASILLTVAGLAALIFGGRLFVNEAVDIAHSLGISEKFIAITILAGGTSLPEFVTCIVAAAKKKGQLALGNILGSNVFNILLILGASALVMPISFENVNFVDLGVLLLSAVLVFTSAFTGKKNVIDRFDGALMLFAYVGYMVWLFLGL